MTRLAAVFVLLAFTSSLAAAGKVSWLHSFDQALVQAQKDSRPIFIDAYADWCEWCHKLDKEVYADPKFVKFMEQFVPVKIDVEDNGDGTHFAEQFQITGLPTLLITNAEGHLTNRIGGFLPVDELISDIRSIQQLVEKAKKNHSDPEVTYQLAKEYLSREMNSESEILFGEVLASKEATNRQKDSAQFSIALAQFYQEKIDAALRSLSTYLASYANGNSEEDALLLLSEIHLERDESDKARYYLHEFLQKYPNSGNVMRARRVLTTLEDSKHSTN